MRLKKVTIQNYKCLKNVTVDFERPRGKCFPGQFLVGANGSGKSCFLEALGLIFTRIMQGEVPGFPFAVEYLAGSPETLICVSPAPSRERKKGRLRVTIDGRTEIKDRIESQYLPRRIVACTSGANHMMDSVLFRSPRASLVSDLYDLAARGGADGAEEIERVLRQYRELDAAPRAFSIDDESARLIVAALFAILPDYDERDLAEEYLRLRGELAGRVDKRFAPVALSLCIDEARLGEALSSRRNSPQYGQLEKLFRESARLYDWTARRPVIEDEDSIRGREETRMSQTAVFLLAAEDGSDPSSAWSKNLSEEYGGDPMSLLSVLLSARRGGVLRDVQLAFRVENCETLLGMEALSEGELMWLARMGLVLMSRTESSAETLFLFDEPDIHFNDGWNADFIKELDRCGTKDGRDLRHEFLIATHSTLLLTDACREQTHLFRADGKGGTETDVSPVSTFGAQREQIAKELFSAEESGSYSFEQIDETLQNAKRADDLEPLLERLGQGYPLFRTYELYYELQQKENGGGESADVLENGDQ